MFHFSKLLLAAAGVCLTMPLNAESLTVTGSAAQTAWVSLAGLDLDSPAGQSQAEDRIRAAANGLCSSSAVEPVDIRIARKACHSSALASGRKELQRFVAGKAIGPSQVATAITITAR
jgi:UrcA family protein